MKLYLPKKGERFLLLGVGEGDAFVEESVYEVVYPSIWRACDNFYSDGMGNAAAITKQPHMYFKLAQGRGGDTPERTLFARVHAVPLPLPRGVTRAALCAAYALGGYPAALAMLEGP